MDGKIERGYFGDRSEFLNLTNSFITAIKAKFASMGMTVEIWAQGPHRTLFRVANEVYALNNNGVEANWEFVGFSN